MAKQRRVRIADHAGNRHVGRQRIQCNRCAERCAGWLHFRKRGEWHSKQVRELRVPAQVVDIEELRARCVGDIARVDPAPGKIPQQPAVDGAQTQLTAPCAFATVRCVRQQPAGFGGGEHRVDRQAGALAHERLEAARREFLAERR